MNLEKTDKESLFKISHEIKNSLAIVKGYISLFDGSIEKYDKYMPSLINAVDHSIDLLKDFSYIGKLEVHLDIMDVNYLLEDIIHDYKPIASLKGIKLMCDIDDEIYIEGDYKRLKQVFINIILNAIDALENTIKPIIVIKTKVIDNKVIIAFEDNGSGMDEYTISNIFNAFYTTKKNGTGLGMYISSEIIKMHNGEIRCESFNHDGSLIEIKLDQYII